MGRYRSGLGAPFLEHPERTFPVPASALVAGPVLFGQLERNPGADAVFCAHTGLEKSSSFRESFNGGLAGTVAHIKFWGVPFEEIPEGEEARRKWLLEEWKKVDEFILAHSGESEAAPFSMG